MVKDRAVKNEWSKGQQSKGWSSQVVKRTVHSSGQNGGEVKWSKWRISLVVKMAEKSSGQVDIRAEQSCGQRNG